MNANKNQFGLRTRPGKSGAIRSGAETKITHLQRAAPRLGSFLANTDIYKSAGRDGPAADPRRLDGPAAVLLIYFNNVYILLFANVA
ncbi:hypothetical protein EVAR_53582_1 [Eumeta japonica]|uniref:Uncharacterized protein n=1 Tax=Eumeta variegata TaxID=151549 RepID=A0A4C1YGP1_EUMVA|nr:hypothetical protein EVAR_53582_1 [Eumeta japonica]